MKEYNKIKCDALIIGGGIGGLTCAAEIKEKNPDIDVLVVEKNFAGYSGKANRGGGVLQYFDLNRIDPVAFVGFHTNAIGAFFTDQPLMAKYVSMNTEMLEKLDGWGVNIPKREDGGYNVIPTGPFTSMICVDLDITLKVRKVAEKLGVRFMDKTVFTDLLTEGNSVSGAVVFSVLDGTVTLIQAKKVVLATGSQNYRVGSMWSSGRGDGYMAAFRAGAELRNVEFGNFAQLVKVKSHNEVVFGENYMYNAKGEHVTKNFCQQRETDISSKAIREWYIQNTSGNGPVHLDFGDEPQHNLELLWERPYGAKFRHLNDDTGAKVDTTLEVCPMLIGEQSPMKVTREMRATIDGLYAVGDCSYCGSGLAGAVPAPPGRNRGSGILNAVFAGLVAARDLAASDCGEYKEICDKQVEKAVARIEAPLAKETGVTAKEVIAVVQQAMAPVEQSVIMHADRIAKALTYVEKAKAMVGDMYAKDLHGVMECLEAEAMVMSAELHYKAADMRKESRGWFLREDYPEMDNENWFKWINAKLVDGQIVLSTEELPTYDWFISPYELFTGLVPITEEEKKSPLFKYYEREMTQAAPEKYAQANQPVDPELALHPYDLNKLFDDGYLPVELGYCNLPDGGATLANITDMPGVTPEMFDFWFAWHGLEDLRYKIWDREDHYFARTRNREKALDKSLSMKERYWDTVHDVDENCGLGKEHIIIGFRNPADIGFDPEKLKDFKGTIVCSGSADAPVIMCHFLRPTENGCELRTRFWFGYSIIDGKPKKILPDGAQFPLEPVKALLNHNIKEFTNLAAILPEVYAEFHADFE